MNGIFITGTDTHVGKTYVACKIAAELVSRHINVIPRKPVESGCQLIHGQLIADDAVKLHQASQSSEPLENICRYRFNEAISPARAARLNNKEVSLTQLHQACTSNINQDDFLLVEGAGGFFSPICENALNADLAKALQLPVVLIAENRLGTINQVLLSLHAIQHYNLNIKAIVLNQISIQNSTDNFDELCQLTTVPVFMFDKDSVAIDITNTIV